MTSNFKETIKGNETELKLTLSKPSLDIMIERTHLINIPDAEEAKYGYIEDLEAEDARGISVTVKRCKPEELTIYDQSIDVAIDRIPSLSGHSH